jgi:hypothetical protein
MNMQAVLKAGGLGAVVMIVLNLLGLIPCVGCVTWLLALAAYVGVGILAAKWMNPPRTSGSGATNGAAAAAIAALVSGVIQMVVSLIYTMITGASQLSQIPAEQLKTIKDMGIDPAMLAGPAAALGVGAVCCTIGLVIAAALGAAGGAYWGNSHQN